MKVHYDAETDHPGAIDNYLAIWFDLGPIDAMQRDRQGFDQGGQFEGNAIGKDMDVAARPGVADQYSVANPPSASRHCQ